MTEVTGHEPPVYGSGWEPGDIVTDRAEDAPPGVVLRDFAGDLWLSRGGGKLSVWLSRDARRPGGWSDTRSDADFVAEAWGELTVARRL